MKEGDPGSILSEGEKGPGEEWGVLDEFPGKGGLSRSNGS